jgi:hypothetical protein
VARAKKDGQEYKPLPKHPHAIYVVDFYNLASFRQALVDVGPHGIVGDEAHRFKNVEGAAAAAPGRTCTRSSCAASRGRSRCSRTSPRRRRRTSTTTNISTGCASGRSTGSPIGSNLVTGQANEAKKPKELKEATERGAKTWTRSAKAGPKSGRRRRGGHQGENRQAAEVGSEGRLRRVRAKLTPAEGRADPARVEDARPVLGARPVA